jgi:hypothetical protein
MINFQLWPPPDWTECVVSWDHILQNSKLHPQELYDWCDNHPVQVDIMCMVGNQLKDLHLDLKILEMQFCLN